jgi:hypothetical protein
MRTTAEVRLQTTEGKQTLQFLAAKMDNWDVTSLIDTSSLDVKGLEKQTVGATEPVVIEVDISDRAIEQVINRL